MSLDVYLRGPIQIVVCECPNCYHEYKREDRELFFQANITHNLGEMARQALIYRELWRPEEIGISKASQLIGPLTEGLNLLKGDQLHFEKFNPENGWGSYNSLVRFVSNYIKACKENPDAEIQVSR